MSATDETFAAADALYDARKYDEAFTLFMTLAEQGDTSSMGRVAIMYENGEGALPSLERSVYWDKRAIEAGCQTSLFNIGITYRRHGFIIEARNQFEISLASGNNEAALELAKLYSVSDKELDTVDYYLKLALADDTLSEDSIDEATEMIVELRVRRDDLLFRLTAASS